MSIKFTLESKEFTAQLAAEHLKFTGIKDILFKSTISVDIYALVYLSEKIDQYYYMGSLT
jgi:hypothetical protein